jgi:DNA/RNA-binding domain of Phe-tRNA-synthetase-like protein
MDIPELTLDSHPRLCPALFVTEFRRPLGDTPSPKGLRALLALEPESDERFPLPREEEVRKDVRDLLRHGGYRPTGRGKPASEYLVRAAGEGKLGSINLAVDACNATSLASGFPISVVDLDLARGPFRIAIAEGGSSYPFNAAGQEIDVSGLLCLFDAEGPCANAVKDAQRTKTTPATRRTLSVIWGCEPHSERVQQARAWYGARLAHAGVTTQLL